MLIETSFFNVQWSTFSEQFVIQICISFAWKTLVNPRLIPEPVPMTLVFFLLSHNKKDRIWRARACRALQKLTLVFWWVRVVTVTVALRYPPVTVMNNQLGTLIPTDSPCPINCRLLGIVVPRRAFTAAPFDVPATIWIVHYMMTFSFRQCKSPPFWNRF